MAGAWDVVVNEEDQLVESREASIVRIDQSLTQAIAQDGVQKASRLRPVFHVTEKPIDNISWYSRMGWALFDILSRDLNSKHVFCSPWIWMSSSWNLHPIVAFLGMTWWKGQLGLSIFLAWAASAQTTNIIVVTKDPELYLGGRLVSADAQHITIGLRDREVTVDRNRIVDSQITVARARTKPPANRAEVKPDPPHEQPKPPGPVGDIEEPGRFFIPWAFPVYTELFGPVRPHPGVKDRFKTPDGIPLFRPNLPLFTPNLHLFRPNLPPVGPPPGRGGRR